MPGQGALRDHLNLVEDREVTLTLAQISAIIGWTPAGGRGTADYIGRPGEPTPFLRNLTAAMEDGWVVTNANQPGRMTFTRKGPPRAPSLVPARPRKPPPTIPDFAMPPLDLRPARTDPRSIRRIPRVVRKRVTDPTTSDRAEPR